MIQTPYLQHSSYFGEPPPCFVVPVIFWDMFGPASIFPFAAIKMPAASPVSFYLLHFQGSARIQIKVEEAGVVRNPWWVTGILMLLVTGVDSG